MLQFKRQPLSGIIAIPTFSRSEELELGLKHVVQANKNFGLPILVVHQIGNNKVAEVLKYYRGSIDYLIELDGTSYSPLQNINRNRLLCYQIGFNWLDLDWVLVVEDDVLIANDSINFVDSIMKRYFSYPGFRGVNLGSRIPKSDSNKLTYSKLRFGINGQASAITQRTWNYYNHKKLMRKSPSYPFDGEFEPFLKSGFMVTPNASRLKDIGWNGTHAPKDPNDTYFKESEASWVGTENLGADGYYLKNSSHNWRQDIRIYRWFLTPWYIFKYFLIVPFVKKLF
jgi:hypothetical protein